MQVSRDSVIQIIAAAEVAVTIDGSLGRRRAGSIPGRRQQLDELKEVLAA